MKAHKKGNNGDGESRLFLSLLSQIKNAQKIPRILSKIRKFPKIRKKFSKGYLQTEFFVINYGKKLG
jgi:hypothetical protein